MKAKRALSLVLAIATILSVFASMSFSVSAASVEYVEVAANTELAEVSKDYGLADNIQDGNILHCFDWKYNDIKAELANIAEAGFTSVQTSPAQPAGTGTWYWLYQPYGFYIGTNSLGSKDDLRNLCTEAEKYGIKVIVDVVANHLNGDTNSVQDDLKDSQYWHTLGSVSSWTDRYQVTHGEIGMRDLNSEHSYVQQVVANYMKELESVGVDGVRWDAAKHIGLPSEDCQFWPAVTKNNSMWHYGEILVGPDDRSSGNEGLMKEYTNYISVTDSTYGKDLRDAFNSGSVPSTNGNWANRGVSTDKLVYWGESHDTWSNNQDWGYSNGMSQNTIDRAYAIAASRQGANALYFSRPSSTNKESIISGQKGSTDFKNKQVAAVNQLKNACGDEKEYYTTGDNCAVVNRESGAVIVLGSGSNRTVTVPNGGSTTAPGTYTDLVSGSTWTVTSSTMTGQVGSTGIAVLLNAKPAGPSASVSPSSKSYTTDTLELTLTFDNATSGQYSINGGAYQSFTNGQKITIGKGTAAGTQTTISVKASNGSTTSDVGTYEYNYSEKAADGIYFDNSSTNWSTVYCYIYKDGSNAPAEWPGLQMTKTDGNIWTIQPPSGYENCSVLFTDNQGNQTPSANEPGYTYSGGAMICDGSTWREHTVIPVATEAPVTTTEPTQTSEVTIPTPTPTSAPTPTPTSTPTPTETSTQAPVKTDPVESDVVIVVPPSPVTTTAPSTTVTTPDLIGGEKYRYGDVDLNDKVSIKDATVLQKALAKQSTLSTIQLIVSDVTSDSKVNVKDATVIQKHCANVVKTFDSGEWYTVPGTSTTEPTEAPQPTTAKVVETDPTEAPSSQPIQVPNTQPTSVPQPTTTEAPVTQATEEPQPTETSTPAPTEAPEPDNYIYLKSTWSSVNCHSWPSGGEGTTWPGTAMESLGNGIFRIQLPDSHNNVVFNGDGQQTTDIVIQGTGMIWDGSWQPYTNNNNSNDDNNSNDTVEVSSDCIYFKDDAGWGTVNCHSWPSGGDGTTWPGTAMESLGNGLYKIKLPEGHTNVVFNAGGDHCKTGDLNVELGKAYNNSTNKWEEV